MKKITITLWIFILFVSLTACNLKTSSYTDPNGNEYEYKLELTGTLPNASKESNIIILTNDNTLTFEQVSKSMYSSNSKHNEGIDYYLMSIE